MIRKAFSLIELLVVVFLISLVYYFIFANVKIQNKQKEKLLYPLTLRPIAKALIKGEGELFCINKCKTCYYSLANSVDINQYEGEIDFGNEVEVYQLDRSNNLEKKEFGRIDDQKVCLRFNLYINQSSTKLIIQNTHGVFYLPSYFGEPQKVATLDEAKELWIKHNRVISSGGDFY
ncbi:MAG: prepilin-type N-terminal cleavage/methylation domain-containing protein [Campylobacterales bacterium]|nr:prepilin-type N-terminal cleavage/methylation domain-containing protein [Campylobacterales bacterium]